MQVVFHIGLHKTGTTYLQQSIFPVLCSNANYLAKGAAQHALRSQNLSPERINFLSEESWSNSIKLPSQGWQSFEEFVAAACALEATSKKIIFVLRKHEEYLWSSYLHELKMGRKHSMTFSDYAYSFGEKGLSFSSRIDLMNAHFKVLVLGHWQLRNEPEIFVKRIADFSGFSDYGKDIFSTVQKPCNLTPITTGSMLASQTFEKVYQSINSPIKAISGQSILSEQHRIQVRDRIIAIAQRYLPVRLQKPLRQKDLPEDLRAEFSRDWEKCLSKLSIV